MMEDDAKPFCASLPPQLREQCDSCSTFETRRSEILLVRETCSQRDGMPQGLQGQRQHPTIKSTTEMSTRTGHSLGKQLMSRPSSKQAKLMP